MRGDLGKGVGSAPLVVAIIKIDLAVIVVSTTLGHGIDHGARGAAILGGIVGGIDLEFLDSGLRAGISGARAPALFGEECLVIVSPVDRVVIQQGADPAEAQKAEAARIVDDSRGQESEVRPAPAVDRKIRDGGLIHDRTKVW